MTPFQSSSVWEMSNEQRAELETKNGKNRRARIILSSGQKMQQEPNISSRVVFACF